MQIGVRCSKCGQRLSEERALYSDLSCVRRATLHNVTLGQQSEFFQG